MSLCQAPTSRHWQLENSVYESVSVMWYFWADNTDFTLSIPMLANLWIIVGSDTDNDVIAAKTKKTDINSVRANSAWMIYQTLCIVPVGIPILT